MIGTGLLANYGMKTLAMRPGWAMETDCEAEGLEDKSEAGHWH